MRIFLFAVEGCGNKNNIQKGNIYFSSPSDKITKKDIDIVKQSFCDQLSKAVLILPDKCIVTAVFEIDEEEISTLPRPSYAEAIESVISKFCDGAYNNLDNARFANFDKEYQPKHLVGMLVELFGKCLNDIKRSGCNASSTEFGELLIDAEKNRMIDDPAAEDPRWKGYIQGIKAAIHRLEMNSSSNENTAAESPLRLEIVGDELVMKIGVNRLNGHEYHPTIPELKFSDPAEWAKEVMYELENEDETGATPISNLLDTAIIAAMDNGSTGIAEDSPTHKGQCVICKKEFAGVRHTKNGQICISCIDIS